jgi:hypothetical protein
VREGWEYLCVVILTEEISVQSELGGVSSNHDGRTVVRKEVDTFT